jgi:hypothetical protein
MPEKYVVVEFTKLPPVPARAGNGGCLLNTLSMMKRTSKAGVTFMPSVELMSHHEPTPRIFCEVEVFWLLKFASPMKMPCQSQENP